MDSRSIAQRHASGSIAALLYPTHGVRDEMRRRGEKPKNHAKENVLHIKKIQREHELQKELAAHQEKPVFKLKRFADVPATGLDELVKPVEAPAETRVFLRKGEGAVSRRTSTAAGSPSSAPTSPAAAAERPAVSYYLEERAQAADSKPGSRGKSVAAAAAKGAAAAAAAAAATAAAGTTAASAGATAADTEAQTFKTNENFGRVPAYLVKRQQERAAEREAQAARERARAEHIEGMVLLSDEERLATLNELRARRAELEAALRRFPLLADTAALQRRRTALEQALVETDKSVRVFERPRVYVTPE